MTGVITMLIYLGIISCLVGAMINQHKLIKKDKTVLLIYLLTLAFVLCNFIYSLYISILGIENVLFFDSIYTLFPIIIVFLTALNLRRKRNDWVIFYFTRCFCYSYDSLLHFLPRKITSFYFECFMVFCKHSTP